MQTANEFMAQAARETKLSDFGDDSFKEGLEILLGALESEAALNRAGEGLFEQRILGALKNRLHVEDWYRRHPEIDSEIIVAPLIGISLPRTGSTALSFLLAQDPNARSLRSYESAQPCPPPAMVTGPDPRIQHLNNDETRPKGAKRHVPSAATGPAECQELMALDFKSQLFLAFAQIPTYAQWLLTADLTTTYAYERRVLKLLQWRSPTSPWRLKAPTHLLYLDHLDKVFPDARFVMTHRDPTDVLLSVIYLFDDYTSKLSDHADPHYTAELNINMWKIGIERAMAFRANGNEHRFFDIDFTAMQQQPIAEVTALYQWLDCPVSHEFETGMQNWWQHNAANRERNPKPDPSHYQFDADQVRPLFAEYIQKTQQWLSQ